MERSDIQDSPRISLTLNPGYDAATLRRAGDEHGNL
jgi:hypothetical protein